MAQQWRKHALHVSMVVGGVIVFFALVFIGAVIRLGMARAWAIYAPQFPFFLLLPLFGVALVGVVIGTLALIVSALRWLTSRLFGARWQSISAAVSTVFGTLIVPIVFVGIVIAMGYMRADNDAKVSTMTSIDDSKALLNALQSQATTVRALGNNAVELMRRLDDTQAILSASKRELAASLSATERQLVAVDSAGRSIASLVEKQALIESRTKELQRLLDGKAPITRGDLERSQRDGLIMGLLLGVIGAWIATGIPAGGRLLLERLRHRSGQKR